jgi:hypothetical protein
MRVPFKWAAVAAAAVIAGGALALEAPAGAKPGGEICNPRIDDCGPDPEPTPVRTGEFVNFSAWVQACEPRLTPWNTIYYWAPGATRTVISVSPHDDGNYTVLQTFTGDSAVHFVHASHGTYHVVSYKPATHQVDSRDWTTC